MRGVVALFAVYSILVIGTDLAQCFSLDNFVRHVFNENVKRQLLEANIRQKRQKDTDRNTKPDKSAVINSADGRQPLPTTTQLPLGEDSGAHCLVGCLRPMINKAPQDAGNETLICPKYEEKKIEDICDGYLQARRCLDGCPESALKNLSMSGFRPLQFMCVDRRADFQKHMPCLTKVCDEVQQQCQPACGSLDESVRQLARIQQQVRGPGSRSRGADMDVPEIMQTIADNCRLVECVGNCSREPMTRRCGPEAYDLQSDTIWTMLSSMAQAMSSIGLRSAWPPQCQALEKHAEAEANESVNESGPNSTDRFVEKQKDGSLSNSTNPETPETGASRVEQTNALPSSRASSTCASAFVLLFSYALLF